MGAYYTPHLTCETQRGTCRWPAAPSTADGENWRYWYGAPLATAEEQKKHAEFLQQQDELMRDEMTKLGDKWPAASWARFAGYCWGYGRPFLNEEEAKKHEEQMKKHEVVDDDSLHYSADSLTIK